MKTLFTKTGRKRMLIAIIAMVVVSSVLFYLYQGGFFLQGLMTVLTTLPFMAVILGLLTAIIPFYKLPYNERFFSTALIWCFIIQFLWMGAMIFGILL